MSLLSPSGGLGVFMGPMKTPRFSAILSADMEPQVPQDAPASGAAGSSKAGSMFTPDAVVAGSKRTFEDRCTEVCETAQGKHGTAMPADSVCKGCCAPGCLQGPLLSMNKMQLLQPQHATSQLV